MPPASEQASEHPLACLIYVFTHLFHSYFYEHACFLQHSNRYSFDYMYVYMHVSNYSFTFSLFYTTFLWNKQTTLPPPRYLSSGAFSTPHFSMRRRSVAVLSTVKTWRCGEKSRRRWREPGGWPLSRLPQPLWIPAICHSCCLALTATLIDNEPRALW